MGAGRKTHTVIMGEKEKEKEKEKSTQFHTSAITARNLRDSDLAGVIFGCKNGTYEECLNKQLFGLPAPHFSYVRKIKPGLPLFLFNYSDRKLHGIFEALSQGQMNINSNAWTQDGDASDYNNIYGTPFPAQVKIRIRMHCRPLQEDEFKPIIVNNYYEPRLFWFELDSAQTKKLISMFSSSQVTPLLKNITSFNASVKPSSASIATKHQGSGAQKPAWAHPKSWKGLFEDNTNNNSDQQNNLHIESESSNPSAAPENWISLFKDNTTSNSRPNPETNLHIDQPNVESWESLYCSDDSRPVPEAEVFHAPFITQVTTCSHPQSSSYDTSCVGASHSEAVSSGMNLSYSDKSTKECSASWTLPGLDAKKKLESLEEKSIHEEDHLRLNSGHECLFPAMPKAKIPTFDHLHHPEAAMASTVDSSMVHSTLAKFFTEVEWLKSSQVKQAQKIHSLEFDLVESRKEIQQLKDQFKKLKSGIPSKLGGAEHPEASQFDLIDESHSTAGDFIYLVGGFDGSCWLSNLDLYSSSDDTLNTLASTTPARKYASATKINKDLYIVGGLEAGDRDRWLDTVESYNLETKQWTSRPPIKTKKGNLGLLSSRDRILAAGGGNSYEFFSDVEMLDMNAGKWIPFPSMLHKRSALAVVEVNGIFYVSGGCDEKDYLKSVERYDPRERWWTGLESMSTERACHSLVVLGEKLYAVGGFTGITMIPTVEMYEPRTDSWMVGESMHSPRGYFGTAVVRENLYVIGGLKNVGPMEVADTVESYMENGQWRQETNWKAIGKRSFFSAVVM